MERPILFKGPLVRAILEGRKTQTRRALKPQPEPCPPDYHRPGHWWPSRTHQSMLHVEDELQNGNGGWKGLAESACPLGQPGDRLWVRETWARDPEDGQLFYRTQGGNDAADWEIVVREGRGRWRPSIHMPRWACRLVLEITDVRVERLQDISAEDCIAEGLGTTLREHEAVTDLRDQWRALWTSTGGDWDSNPWVWAITFRPAPQEIA